MRACLVVVMSGCLAGCELRQSFVSANDGGRDAAPPESGDAGIVWPDGGLPARACPPPPDPGTPPPIVAVWEGYTENPQVSGSDAVRIVLRSSASGDLSGTAVFGGGTPPPSPPDSETCYPDGTWWERGGMSPLWVIEGFEYPAVASSMSDLRLKVPLLAFAPWTDWCACQIPVPNSPEGGWACLPNLGGRGTPDGQCFLRVSDTEEIRFPCCKLALCQHSTACQCTESACAIDTQTFWTLDLSVNGSRADGTMTFGQGGGVHLQRTQ